VFGATSTITFGDEVDPSKPGPAKQDKKTESPAKKP
jgi:hypothetical protein